MQIYNPRRVNCSRRALYLFLGEGENSVTHIFAQELEPFKLYSVQRRAWHTHALSVDAKLLIVENRNTAGTNSPRIEIPPEQHAEILRLTHRLWMDHSNATSPVFTIACPATPALPPTIRR
jgi:ABC-type uncharacterized transport system auxiliary subunit